MTTEFKYIAFLILLCIPIILSDDGVDSDDELVFAHILFRHGDRNIIATYPTDPWKSEEHWPGGLGQLTNTGRQQHYELGSYFRKRYISLMPNNGSYHMDNIYVRSTDVDRTLMSAAHNLAGMFPPADSQIWNHTLLWQAIPIHTKPEDEDYVLAMKKECPLYDRTYNEYLQTNEIQRVLKNNRSLIEYLQQHTGKTIETICHVKSVYQALWVENLKNFPLPSWTDKVFVSGGDMEKLANLCFKLPTSTKLLARLKVGFFLREILDHFNDKKDGKLSPNRSLWIYSAHDTTLANILNGLGLFEKPHIPIYASSMFFELHKSNGKYHIEIYYKRYRGEYTDPLEPLNIPGCGPKCPLDKFYEVYKEIITTADFDTECDVPKPVENTKYSGIIPTSSATKSQFSFAWLIAASIVLFAN